MIVPEGWPFVLIPAFAGVVVVILGWPYPGWVMVAIACCALVLFRNPVRVATAPARVVCAPVDGRVVAVAKEMAVAEMESTCTVRISTSLWDVHVVRAPLAGTLTAQQPPEADAFVLTDGWSGTILLRFEAAGRRLQRAKRQSNGVVERGQPLALLPLGGRCSLLLPASARLLVHPGDRVRAGHSPLATLDDTAAA